MLGMQRSGSGSVEVEGTKGYVATSCWQKRRFGVPQGSILVPLMFVNDLLQAIRCGSINMHADDTTLYTAAQTTEETIDMFRTDAQSTLD